MSRPLKYGDLVLDGKGMCGIVVSHPDHTGTVTVAWGNGLEEVCREACLDPPATEPANFAEWVDRRRQPVERAIWAYIGHGHPNTFAEYNVAVIGLFTSLARVACRLPEDAFDDMPKADFLHEIVGMLMAHARKQGVHHEPPQGTGSPHDEAR